MVVYYLLTSEQWFSNCHTQNHLESRLKHRLLGSSPELESTGLEKGISDNSQVRSAVFLWGSYFENSCLEVFSNYNLSDQPDSSSTRKKLDLGQSAWAWVHNSNSPIHYCSVFSVSRFIILTIGFRRQ